MGEHDCWFHGEEPIPDNVYRVCFECGHAWTAEVLLAEHNKHLAVYDEKPETDVENVFCCPLCIHDW